MVVPAVAADGDGEGFEMIGAVWSVLRPRVFFSGPIANQSFLVAAVHEHDPRVFLLILSDVYELLGQYQHVRTCLLAIIFTTRYITPVATVEGGRGGGMQAVAAMPFYSEHLELHPEDRESLLSVHPATFLVRAQ